MWLWILQEKTRDILPLFFNKKNKEKGNIKNNEEINENTNIWIKILLPKEVWHNQKKNIKI